MCLIRNFPSRVKMKSHDMSWDGMLDCYRIAVAAWLEKIIIFYNMKWYVMGRFGSEDLLGCFNRIARSWTSSCYTRWVGQVKDRSRTFMDDKGECCQWDAMKTWFMDDQMSLESGNLKFHDMGICRVTGNWDGIGRKWRRRGECYRTRLEEWNPRAPSEIGIGFRLVFWKNNYFFIIWKCEDVGMTSVDMGNWDGR